MTQRVKCVNKSQQHQGCEWPWPPCPSTYAKKALVNLVCRWRRQCPAALTSRRFRMLFSCASLGCWLIFSRLVAGALGYRRRYRRGSRCRCRCRCRCRPVTAVAWRQIPFSGGVVGDSWSRLHLTGEEFMASALWDSLASPGCWHSDSQRFLIHIDVIQNFYIFSIHWRWSDYFLGILMGSFGDVCRADSDSGAHGEIHLRNAVVGDAIANQWQARD